MQDTVIDLSKAVLWDPDADNDERRIEGDALKGHVFIPAERYGKKTRVVIASRTDCEVRTVRMTTQVLIDVCGKALSTYDFTASTGEVMTAINGTERNLLMGKGAVSVSREAVRRMKKTTENADFKLMVLI